MCGGWTPSLHLFSQSRGKLRWDPARTVFLPGSSHEAEVSVGGCAGTDSVEAYELYLQARQYGTEATREELNTAIAQLRTALDIDPQFALAWARRGAAGRYPLRLGGGSRPLEEVSPDGLLEHLPRALGHGLERVRAVVHLLGAMDELRRDRDGAGPPYVVLEHLYDAFFRRSFVSMEMNHCGVLRKITGFLERHECGY